MVSMLCGVGGGIRTDTLCVLLVFFLFFGGVSGVSEVSASGDFQLNLTHYNVEVESESGYVNIHDLNDALLFRLGGYEQFCFDCFGDVFDKESLTHTLDQTTFGDTTILTFNVSNSAIDLTQIYEFNDLRYDFDYTFYYTFNKDMKMRDQLFLMDYNEAYINNLDDGIDGWELRDDFSAGSISSNNDPNYSRSGKSLDIMMNGIANASIRAKSPRFDNMADNEIVSFWVFPTAGVSTIKVMLASSSRDIDYRYKYFTLKPEMWNKIEWNYHEVGTNSNNFDINDVTKIIFYIHSVYFYSSTAHFYIDDIKFMKDNFDNILIFDAYNHDFMDLSSGSRASYYAPRLLKTGFKNSDVSLLVNSRYSNKGQIEQIDSGNTMSETVPHFYTFSMDNHRFKATHNDDGEYIGGSVLLDYDLARNGYTYGGRLNFNLKPPSNEIFAAKFPRGYEAAYTFTDDTDNCIEDTTKGTYYGTSDESDPNFGKKGFYGHDIKILTTAFNYGGAANSWTNGSLKWLKDLAALGFEIGPHDFANVDDGIDRAVLNSVLNDFINEFTVYTTVRHSRLIYSFCGLGRIETDPNYYWLDLFENAPDTKYTWSGGLQYGDRNAYNDPWQLPHHDGRLDYLGNPKKIYIYGRESSAYGWIRGGQGWGIEWNPQRIDELIEQKGFAHIYIHTRSKSTNYTSAMCYNNGSDWVIYAEADNLLGYLEQKMNEGDLWIEPPHVIFDYMLDKENIDVDQYDSNTVVVTNYNDKAISGFTLEVQDSNIGSAKIGENYQIFIKDNIVTLPKLATNESVGVEISLGDFYDSSIPRLLGVSPNVRVDGAVFDGNDIILNISATGRGYQEDRSLIVDTANVFPYYNIYVDGILYNENVFSKTCVITIPVTEEHEIVITHDNMCSPVNFADYSMLAVNWQKVGSGLSGDINEDDRVDFTDLAILTGCWLYEDN